MSSQAVNENRAIITARRMTISCSVDFLFMWVLLLLTAPHCCSGPSGISLMALISYCIMPSSPLVLFCRYHDMRKMPHMITCYN